MKKITILASLLFTVISSTAFADSVDTLNIKKDSSGAVIVSGNLDVAKTNQQLILTVTNNGEMVMAEQTVVSEVKDSKAYYEFAPILFPYNAPSGYYTYTVSGRYIDSTKSVTDDKMTVSADDFYSKITELNSKIQLGSQEEAYNYLSSNVASFGVDASALGLVDEAKNVFKKLLMDKQFACSEGDYDSIENARVEFTNRYNDLISIAMFYQIDSLESYNNWIEKFSSEFPNETNDGDMYPYYTRIKNKQTAADKVSYLSNAYLNKKKFGSFAQEKENIKKIFYEAVFLTNISEENAAVTQNIITGFSDYFPTDNTYYNKLSSQKKGEIFTKIKGNSYSDVAAVCEDFYKYSKQLSSGSSTSGGGGGSSSGGSSSSGAGRWGNDTSSVAIPINTAKDEVIFSDIENVSWAKEAILDLYSRNIVSGKAEKTFAPDDNVTRAEFLKMVVLAKNLKMVPATENVFGDVAADAWYADVVNTAKANGIITGDENNNFNPDKQITRQDMSIIVARALGYKPDGKDYAPFGDLDSIDDYAVEYVVYLYEQQLLMGNDEGLFLPKNNTRRSEAAVLIHRVIMSNEL